MSSIWILVVFIALWPVAPGCNVLYDAFVRDKQEETAENHIGGKEDEMLFFTLPSTLVFPIYLFACGTTHCSRNRERIL
jgi:hypothetical protein